MGKATGFGDGHLCLYPSSGLSLEWPGPGTNPWCEDTGCRGEGRQSRPLWASHGPAFTLWELILCPTEPSPWIRAVSGRDGPLTPGEKGSWNGELQRIGDCCREVGFGSWAGCEPLRHSLGRAVRDGTAVTAPHPHTHRGFWVPSGSQHPSMSGSMHSLGLTSSRHHLCPPGCTCQRRRGRCPPPELQGRLRGECPVMCWACGLYAGGGPDHPGA